MTDELAGLDNRLGFLHRAAARMLRTQFRRGDVLARLGGAEFLVLTSGHEDPDALVQRLRASLGAHNRAAQQSLTLRIGLAEANPGQNLEQLLLEADNALRRSGRGRAGDSA